MRVFRFDSDVVLETTSGLTRLRVTPCNDGFRVVGVLREQLFDAEMPDPKAASDADLAKAAFDFAVSTFVRQP